MKRSKIKIGSFQTLMAVKKNKGCIVLPYDAAQLSRPLRTCWTNILLLSSGSFYPDDDSSRFLKVLVTTQETAQCCNAVKLHLYTGSVCEVANR